MTTSTFAEPQTIDTQPPFTEKAKALGARATAAIGDQASAVLDTIRPRIDAVSDYARAEPTKAMLIAAATGAGLMALVALAAGRSSSSRVKDLDRSDLAAALRSFAASAPKAVNDAADAGRKQASTMADAGREHASAAADALADGWKQLREQAGPVMDRIRPQIDAVTTFAKEDPIKAAAGVAIAGAVLAGLVALLRSND
jgi:ElaB/YqjD/DUF883 family membrane-anchored ribosome-binding protein